MALTLCTETDDVVSLEDYTEHVSRNVDPRDLGSISASAAKLKALANNKTFLVEKLNRELMDWRNCQADNSYTAQTLILGGGNDFLIRANIWMPPAKDLAGRTDQNNLFSYQVPHDHNFSFLTVGYFGPGYETTIYEYDSTSVRGEIGEVVHLNFLERTTLPAGKVMLYRASQDVHCQEHPKEFSISLNLLLSPPEIVQRDQFLFDLNSSIITKHVKTAASSRVMLCRVARHIGNSKSAALLHELAAKHDSPRVRLTAVHSLVELESASREKIWKEALSDPNPTIRDHARRAINGLA